MLLSKITAISRKGELKTVVLSDRFGVSDFSLFYCFLDWNCKKVRKSSSSSSSSFLCFQFSLPKYSRLNLVYSFIYILFVICK